MQELQNENDKLKREVQALTRSIAESTSFENSGKMSPAGKKFLGECITTPGQRSLIL